jgi:hypothetical protein
MPIALAISVRGLRRGPQVYFHQSDDNGNPLGAYFDPKPLIEFGGDVFRPVDSR